MKTFIYLLLAFASVCFLPIQASEIGSKTPNDVYQRVMLLKQQVSALRENSEVSNVWPSVTQNENLAPRHVLEKSLEVLDKIKRLRRIRKMGEITVPHFPTRHITPNEIFDLVGRLIEELNLFPELEKWTPTPVVKITGKKPSDVYQALWNISLAMNPLLGVRGLKPTDVYEQSLKILEQVKFLRISQSLPPSIVKIDKTYGKRPNHSLQQAYRLMNKIALAEHNLWIVPISVPKVPRREIKPGEVYDALLIVQAELERIKYRLGIERNIVIPKLEGHKTPDDVLYNLVLATELMPEFSTQMPIKQYPQQSLEKTPSHIFALTEHIIQELLEYRRHRGIQVSIRDIPKQNNLQTLNIYQKSLHVLEKVNRIRMQEGIGPLALPQTHLRKITLTEVYDLIIRLDAELQILYDRVESKAHLAALEQIPFLQNKTESDVFRQMWRISYLLDAVLGNEGYTSSDVYKQAHLVVEELKIIGQVTNRNTENFPLPELTLGSQPSDVLKQISIMTKMIKTLKTRIGLLAGSIPYTPPPEKITPNDVHNGVEIIRTELEHIKVHLGISHTAISTKTYNDKTPSDVLQQLKLATQLLESFIN